MATTTQKPPSPSSAEAISEAVHDLQARVAALRLAVTTLREPSIDAATREFFLASADQEAVRLATELAGVSALAKCFADRSAPEAVDLTAALREAAGITSRSGARVHVEVAGPVGARARPGALAAGLPIVLQLVADTEGEAVAQAAPAGGRGVVTVFRRDGAKVPRSRLLARLIEGLGAEPVENQEALAFSFPGASS